MIEVLYKTVHHFFPHFLQWLKDIDDPRDQTQITYPINHLMWIGILLFLFKLKSRRQAEYFFDTQEFVHNFNYLAKTSEGNIADPDTLEYLLEKVSPEEVSDLRKEMINRLIRMRSLEKFRLFGTYYLIAFDGTGHLTFKDRHCEHCLVREKDNKILYYYHNVVEAKLICENGMALSIGTEFIENENESVSKQDCELKAFHRLAEKLKKDFPQLKICIQLDSLYAGQPVFDSCKDYGWEYIITFKEGSISTVYEEYDSLKAQDKQNIKVVKGNNICQKFDWVNDIEYKECKALNIFGCNERKDDEEKQYVWLTSFVINQNNVIELAKGGRLRWKIENEGFNIQKNGGYNLEHAYSQDTIGLKNFYLLLQIAHIINLLMEKGSLLSKDQIKKVFGGIRNIARKLLEDFRTRAISTDELQNIISVPFQIRFDST